MTTKLDRLTMLRDTLLECMQECVKDAYEWQTYDSMTQRVNDLIHEEHRQLGYKAVYPIVDGCSREALFEGSPEACKVYVDILLENHQEMKGNIIVLNI